MEADTHRAIISFKYSNKSPTFHCGGANNAQLQAVLLRDKNAPFDLYELPIQIPTANTSAPPTIT